MEDSVAKEFFRKCLPKGKDGDLFRCICGNGMRKNSLTTHWRLYCKITTKNPEMLTQQSLGRI